MFEVRTVILGENCYVSQYLTDAIGKDIPIVHRVVRSYTEEDKKLKAKNKKAGYVVLLHAVSLLRQGTNP